MVLQEFAQKQETKAPQASDYSDWPALGDGGHHASGNLRNGSPFGPVMEAEEGMHRMGHPPIPEVEILPCDPSLEPVAHYEE